MGDTASGPQQVRELYLGPDNLKDLVHTPTPRCGALEKDRILGKLAALLVTTDGHFYSPESTRILQ